MNLFESWNLNRAVRAKNRIWLAPLTNMQSHADGTLSLDEQKFLVQRAQGGFGVVETCAAYVEQAGKAWPGELGVDRDEGVARLSELANELHEHGTLGIVQLFHGGLRADPSVSGLPAWSASAHHDPPASAGSSAQIEQAIEAFRAAAARCITAKFDGVELHAAHGYLLSQFLSTEYNRRQDEYGGSLENRARLLRKTTRAVRTAIGDRALVVRLSPEDFGQAKGLDLDETLQLAKWLEEDGMDVLHLSLWRSKLNTQKRPEQHATWLFREALSRSTRLVVAGAIWTLDDAQTQLELGADAVALGRAAIGHADWPQQIQEGRSVSPPPYSHDHLREQGLNETFVSYMTKWKGFVANELARAP